MDIARSERSTELAADLRTFVDEAVRPARAMNDAAVAASPDRQPAIAAELQQSARDAGLWNLCVRHLEHGPGLTFVEDAPLAEMMGPHPLAQEATNCDPPSNVNADTMFVYGSREQHERWLLPSSTGRSSRRSR